jgi:hypothetical protein
MDKKNYRGGEEEEENVSSYRMTLMKRQDAGV